MPTRGHQAAADKNHVGHFKDSCQLTDGIQKHDFRNNQLSVQLLLIGFQLSPANEGESLLVQELSGRLKPIRMARGKDQHRLWEMAADLLPGLEYQLLLAGHGAARYHHRTTLGLTQGGLQHRRQSAKLGRRSVELQITGDHDAVARHTQKPEALGIALSLGADQVDVVKHAAHEEPEALVTAK